MAGFLAVFILTGSLSAYELIVPSEAASEARSLRATSEKQSESVQLLKFETPEEFEEAKRHLESRGVTWEENARFRADVTNENIEFDLTSFDVLLGNQWSLLNRGDARAGFFAGGDIDVLRAWSMSEGRGRLYIVDSGVDLRVEDLVDRVVVALSAIDGKGPEDENSHGTHVTSIAAAARNLVGIMGVAPGDVDVVSIRMLDESNSGDTYTAIRAYELLKQDLEEYLARDPRNYAVISNSWGGDQFSPSLQRAMQAVTGPRVLILTSAGNERRNNDESPYYPCNFNLVNSICVAASDRSDFLTNFSSFGRQSVHIMAPGMDILGAIPGIQQGSQFLSRYAEKSGTSQATPHVAGAALLAWAVNAEFSASDIKNILLQSVDRIPGAENEVLSGGRLNAFRAVLMASGEDPDAANRGFSQVSNDGGGCAAHATGEESSRAFFGLLCVLFLILISIRYSVYRIPNTEF